MENVAGKFLRRSYSSWSSTLANYELYTYFCAGLLTDVHIFAASCL
jgi:hypothetical protein